MTLQLINISRRVKRNWIIRNLNLEVGDGECIALLGPSGCGKSSTLRIIAGLDKPTEGQLLINGKLVNNISPVDRRVGMVFQSYALFPHLSVAQNLSLGLKVRGDSLTKQKEKVSSILSIMQLDEYSERLPIQLSGGQRQRVALARALLRDPYVYLLDEPMSNLDAQLREELRPELRRLILSGDQPVVYVTHDQHEAMAMANRIAVLNNGTLEQIGTPEELYKKPSSLFVARFIGRPQINILRSSTNIIKAIRPEDIQIKAEGIRCRLLQKEWLGINQLIYLESPKGHIKVICDSRKSFSDSIYVDWDESNEHHFDAYTNKRLN